MKRRISITLTILGLLLGFALWSVGRGMKTNAAPAMPATQANTITVTNTNDSGPGSLRQAIADAAPGDTIDFDLSGCPCTITLTSGELFINKPLAINGPGAPALSIDGNNNSRVFNIRQNGTVTLAGLTVTNGNGQGASINNGFGGGIQGFGGTLIINDCVVVGNSSLSGPGTGGGVHQTFGVLRITGSVISGNRAGFSGGVSIQNATASMTNCTISGNSATAAVGGINTLSSAGAADLTLTNCTVTGNSGPVGGVRVISQRADVAMTRLKNTLVAGNSPRNFGTAESGSGSATVTTLGHNLDSDGSSGFANGVNGDLVGSPGNPLDALLGPLADNGGPTRTHALLPGSPAINAGSNALALDADGNPLQFDQRGPGFPRILGGTVNIGAFEGAPDLNRFVLLAQEGVELNQRASVVSGDVGARAMSGGPFLGDGVEVSVGQQVEMLDPASRLLGDSILIRQGATVFNPHYNDITNNGAALGMPVTPLDLSQIPALPALPAITPGAENIEVAQLGALTLDAGGYGDLVVRQRATVTFTGGVYHFRSWDVGQEVKLHFLAPTEIRIADKLGVDQRGYLGPAPETGLSAKDIVIYVGGQNGQSGALGVDPKAAVFGQETMLKANVVVPNGTLLLRQRAEATGAFFGKWVQAGQQVKFTLDSRFGL